jgi:23S rRNA pseudouridine1911/1915/1917 synthase
MIPILYQDNHCLALDKPAGMLSQGDITGERSVVDVARDWIKEEFKKPGNVYVGLVHRLDQVTSGVVLLARTSKGASRLSEQFRDGKVGKTYLAMVEGFPASDEGEWEDFLWKDEATNVVRTAEPDEPGARRACLKYRVVERGRATSTIELIPGTGRGHQLRVQLSSRGLPILGDRKYGASKALSARDGGLRIALHAMELSFSHPTKGDAIVVKSPMPRDWPIRL